MNIETDRLIIREYTLNEAPFIYQLMNSEGWLTNVGDRGIKTLEDAERYMLKNYLRSYELYGFGPYLISLKDSGIPIGSVGLYKRDNLKHPDIGFAFLPEYVNKGYAFESAHAVMQFGLEKLGLQKITGITLPNNLPSIKLLKKLGLSEIGTYSFKDGEELLLFSN